MIRPSHWETIKTLLPASDSWVQGEDGIRLAAYDVYDWIYRTYPEVFKVLMRGQEGLPIYIPSGRQVIETAHRFMAPGIRIVVDSDFGTDAEKALGSQVMDDFLKRERFASKFSANKRNGLIKGDWLWMLRADLEFPEGSRISILPVDPSTYFPQFLDDNTMNPRIAAHLVETTLDREGKPAIRKLSYTKETGTGGPSTIMVFDAVYKPEEWGQPGTDMALGSPIEILMPLASLPPEITSLPVYHIANAGDSEGPWGWSEMAGIERLMLAINQGVTDEELTLILEGLGVYVSDAGAPLDEAGNEVPWNIGPARVVETPKGSTFGRVSANQNITPYLDHLRYLHQQIDLTTGDNDVTKGLVDVQVAESGIALAIRMAPMLARMEEKELGINDTHGNLFFDLRNWFSAFEGINLENVRYTIHYSEKLPQNRAQLLKDVLAMYSASPPIISGQEARRQLEAVGFNFFGDDTSIWAEILQEQADFLDSTSTRIATDLATLAVPADMTPEMAIQLMQAATQLVRAGADPATALAQVGLSSATVTPVTPGA